MSYCLNPSCSYTQNANNARFCSKCGNRLLLLERYRPIRAIGEGGFGKTFLAVDEAKPSKPRCVIKQFAPQGIGNLEKAAELFQQEAVRLDELGKHAQIPELLAHYQQGNSQYLIQEFIDGPTLAEELAEQGIFPQTKIKQLLDNLLPVLQFIHSGNVIHRDIKPANIIRRRTDGQHCLVDFGAAKYATGTALIRTGTLIGSAEYTPFEQARGKAVFASDIYSLGVTCIHLLTDVSPFDLVDGNNAWVWRDYLKSNIVSDRLGTVLDKMIAPAVNQRYQSAAEVIKELQPQKIQLNSSPVIPITSNVSEKASQVQLDSSVGIDYSHLEQFLKVSNYLEADSETKRIMLEIARISCDGSLSGIRKFPCQDLQTLDRLWTNHGKENLVSRIKGGFGRYGFGFVVFTELEARFAECSIQPPQISAIPHPVSTSPVLAHGQEYEQLKEFLFLCLWKQADEETSRLILKIANRELQGYLIKEDIDRFPCQSLNHIDQLWMHYSKNHFGFSVQKQIWHGSSSDDFYQKVGWCGSSYDWLPYNELKFKLSAPLGHLPWWCGLFRKGGFGKGILANFWEGWNGEAIASFLKKLEDCST